MSNSKPSIAIYDSYLAMIRNSLGSRQYQNLFLEIDGQKRDVIQGGRLACALFASAILHQFKLIKEPHAPVKSMVRDLKESGWEEVDLNTPIEKLKPGTVITWGPEENDNEQHDHIGFFMGNNEAISNSSTEKVPVIHHWTYGTKSDGTPKRAVTGLYWQPNLQIKTN